MKAQAATFAMVMAATFVILLAILHVVRADLDPRWHMISEYGLAHCNRVRHIHGDLAAQGCDGVGLRDWMAESRFGSCVGCLGVRGGVAIPILVTGHVIGVVLAGTCAEAPLRS